MGRERESFLKMILKLNVLATQEALPYSFLFPLLFDHIAEHFSSALALPVQEVWRHSALWHHFLSLVLSLAFLMLLDPTAQGGMYLVRSMCRVYAVYLLEWLRNVM